MEMAFKKSQKLRLKILGKREDYYLFARFLESLVGNCLAITIVAQYLEELPSFSVKEFVVSAWTTTLRKNHAKLLDRICQSSFRLRIAAFINVSDTEATGPLYMLAFCRERVSYQWIDFWSDIEDHTLPNREPENVSRHQSHEDGAGPLTNFLRAHIQKPVSLSLIEDDTDGRYWTLHPLLPYVLEASLSREFWQKLRLTFKGFYTDRTLQWSQITSVGNRRRYWNSALVDADLGRERLNFIISAWSFLQDGTSVSDIPWHLFASLFLFHPIGTNIDLETMATMAALLEDAVHSYTDAPLHKRIRSFTQQVLESVRPPKKTFKELHEASECSCLALLDALEYAIWLCHYYRVYNGYGSEARNLSKKITNLLTKHQRSYADDDHRNDPRTIVIMNNARVQLALYAAILNNFEEARKIVQGISKTHISNLLLDELNKNTVAHTLAVLSHAELSLSPDTTLEALDATDLQIDMLAEESWDI